MITTQTKNKFESWNSFDGFNLKWGQMFENLFSENEDNFEVKDAAVTLHDPEEFKSGVTFKARLIGTVQVMLPNSDEDAIVLLRKVRIQFRRRYIKKKEVLLKITSTGLVLSLRGNNMDGCSISDVVIDDVTFNRINYILYDKFDRLIFCYIYQLRDDQYKLTLMKAKSRFVVCKIVKNTSFAYDKFQSDHEVVRTLETSQKLKVEKQHKQEETKLIGKISSKQKSNSDLKAYIESLKTQLRHQIQEREKIEVEISDLLQQCDAITQRFVIDNQSMIECKPEEATNNDTNNRMYTSQNNVYGQDFVNQTYDHHTNSQNKNFSLYPTNGDENSNYANSYFGNAATKNSYSNYWMENL